MTIKLLVASILGLISLMASAQQYVQGYCRSDGTCVSGYFKSEPNGTAADNYGTAGNLNPNTGQISTRELEIPNTWSNPVQPGSGNVYQIGPRGGQYYISESGRKVYKRKD